MKTTQKVALTSLAVISVTLGAVVSLGGGKLFETGGNGGWFSGLLTADALKQPGADTRVADQNTAVPMRDPVRGKEDLDSALSRMASLPYVSSEDALAGALAGDAPGMAQLQAYLDAAGFDADALESRSNTLFSALEAGRDLEFTRSETRNAARRIVSAARLTTQSAFLFPVALYDDFRANAAYTAWDVGSGDKAAFGDFIRSGSDSGILGGANVVYFEDDASSSVMSEGATEFSVIRLPTELKGDLRIFAFSATERTEGGPYPLPFGYSLSADGQPYRIVDGRKATGTPYVSVFDEDVALHASNVTFDLSRTRASDIADQIPSTDDAATSSAPTLLRVGEISGRSGRTYAQTAGNDAIERGSLLSLPIKENSGRLRVAIAQLAGQKTIANGFLVGPDPMAPALARIAERARGLENTDALVASVPQKSVAKAAKQPRPRSSKEPTGFLAVKTVDFPTALAGALSGDTQGNRDLASYFDAAGGDLGRLENRAMALIDGLAARGYLNDFLTLAEAANRITDAAAKAASTTYLMNGFIGRDFDLPNPETGWDLGADGVSPHTGFIRTSSKSNVILGQNVRSGRNPEPTPLVQDFLTRIEGMRFDMPSAYYRVIMLVAPTAGQAGRSPLGEVISINGEDQRLRDLRKAGPQIWARLAGGDISVHGGLEGYGSVDPRLEDMLEADGDLAPLIELFMKGGVYTKLPSIGQDIDPNSTLGSGQRNAMAYASRAFVNDAGGMIIDFPAAPQGGTVLGAIIQGESDPGPLAERLAERIAQLLGSTAPAAGFLPNDIFPAAGNVFAAAFNAPTQVASNQNGTGRSAPTGTIGPVGGGGALAPLDDTGTDTEGEETDTDGGETDTDGGETDTAGTDTAGTDTAGTDTAGTDTAGTDTAGTDTAGTDTAGTDTAGTDTAGTDTAGTDTAGTDTAGTDTAGTDTAGTDTAGTDTAGTDTAGTDTAGTDTAGTDTAGTDTAGTDTAGTDTAGTDTAGTDTAGTDTAGTDTAGTDTAGTDTAGTDTAGTDTAGTDTAGTDTAGTDTAGTDTAGTDTAGTDTAGTDTAGTDTAGTATAGTDTAATDTAGTDTAGTDTAGTDTAGTDTAGTDTAGTDTAGTDTAGTDTAGTDTAGTDTAGTDTAGTDTAGTDTAGTDTAGTDTAGTDTAGTDTAGTDTAGTDTAGTDTAGTDTAGTDTAGTDTAGTDTAGTDTAGTDTAGTDTAGTDTAGTDTAGTDTAGTDTAGTDTAGTDTAGTDTAGTDTAGTDTAGTDTAGTDTAGTDTAGTDTAGTDTAGTDTAGTDTAGTDTAGTDTAGTDTAGTDTAGTDTAGTDTAGTDTAGTDTAGTDTAGTDTAGTDTAGTDTAGTDTAGTDTAGTDTAGTDTAGTDTAGTDTAGTDTAGTDTAGTDTAGTDTAGTDTAGTDTAGTDTAGTDTAGTDTAGTDTAGTDTAGTDTAGTDTAGTDTAGTDTAGTDTAGTDTAGTDTAGTDTAGTDTAGTDTAGTDTAGTDTAGTDTAGTDTAGTDTAGTDTAGTDTAGTDTAGTDTAGTDTAGTDTAGTDTAGTDTAGTDTAGTDTAGTDTAGTDTAGTDTAGTDTAGTDTAGTDTAGTDTAGTDTAGTDTAGTDTAGTDTAGTDTAGTDTAGTDTAGTDTAGTDTAGTDTAGTDTDGGDLVLRPDAGGPYQVLVEEEFTLDGSASMFNIGLDEFDIEWILSGIDGEVLRVTGLGVPGSPFSPGTISLSEAGIYDLTLTFTFGDLIRSSDGIVIVIAGNEVPVPAAILLFLPGLFGLILLRRRKI